MTVAIISDIHSNLAALKAVRKDIKKQNISECYCLGDVVGYGPWPNECIDLVRDMCGDKVILGNHEKAVIEGADLWCVRARLIIEWTQVQVGMKKGWFRRKKTDRSNWIENLPVHMRILDAQAFHGSPRDPVHEYISELDTKLYKTELGVKNTKMERIFAKVAGLCFVGHTHVPGAFVDEKPETLYLKPEHTGKGFKRGPGKAVVNVGSVGQPRDQDPRACYATYDGECVNWHRVPYTVSKTVRAMRQRIPFAGSHAKRLFAGK